MFRTLLKNKKAQNTAEYALLIALVVAGVIAMQTYAQRALQARVRDASATLAQMTNELGTTKQYEPYYLSTNYEVERYSEEFVHLDNATSDKDMFSNRARGTGGFQKSTYNATLNGIVDNI